MPTWYSLGAGIWTQSQCLLSDNQVISLAPFLGCWDRVPLCSSSWPLTQYIVQSSFELEGHAFPASWVLKFQICITTPGSQELVYVEWEPMVMPRLHPPDCATCVTYMTQPSTINSFLLLARPGFLISSLLPHTVSQCPFLFSERHSFKLSPKPYWPIHTWISK